MSANRRALEFLQSIALEFALCGNEKWIGLWQNNVSFKRKMVINLKSKLCLSAAVFIWEKFYLHILLFFAWPKNILINEICFVIKYVWNFLLILSSMNSFTYLENDIYFWVIAAGNLKLCKGKCLHRIHIYFLGRSNIYCH